MIHNLLLLKIAGIIFISLTGSMLHFTYDWSCHYKPLALISSVNESTWEHLKIAFWPALIYFIFEYCFIFSSSNNFFIATAVCLLLIPISIIIIFYTYKAILGHNLLIIDISVFIISITIGQMASYNILTKIQLPSYLTFISILVIALLIIAFSCFTYFPPKFFLFKDPRNGGYGLNKK